MYIMWRSLKVLLFLENDRKENQEKITGLPPKDETVKTTTNKQTILQSLGCFEFSFFIGLFIGIQGVPRNITVSEWF